MEFYVILIKTGGGDLMVHNPAGFWVRFGANLLDGLLFLFVSWIIFIFITSTYADEISNLLQLVYVLLVPLIWYGYTIGKRICTIRILRMDGKNVTFWTMVKRILVSGLLYASPLLISILIATSMAGSEALQLLTVSNEQFQDTLLILNESMRTVSTVISVGSLLSLSLFATSAFMVGVTKSRRSIHDFIAGTYVTYDTPEDTKELYSEEREINQSHG